MPIYEYRCARCGRVSSFLVRNVSAHTAPACPKCGHPKTERVFSRVAVIGGRKGRASNRDDADASPPADFEKPPEVGDDEPAAPGEGGPTEAELAEVESLLTSMDENDPRSMGRAMRRMAEIAREPLEGEVEEVVRRLEAGEDPDSIEEKMGDTLGPAGGATDELYDG